MLSLITRGGGATKRTGKGAGQVKVYPYKKGRKKLGGGGTKDFGYNTGG